ncbi:unnamed protein product [Candida verbasci]|uniref:GOLD domain-containing protein n=1 Tax=Candida verbasci TaxID=1227364 RepID=A0A9W4XEL0_9ASCO|nr:unnamed protein product [Candida verbasci]
MIKKLIILYIFLLSFARALGIIVSPTKDAKSNINKLSSPNNLENCINYQVNPNDIIILNVKNIERIHSQILNLVIFDSNGNILRNQRNLAKTDKEFDLILKNTDVTINEKREVVKDFIHICFDNLYNDLSWSFKPRDYELELGINIKSNMEYTNYNIYKKYFSNDLEQEKQQVDNEEFDSAIFDQKISKVRHELDLIVENLQNSEEILNDLKLQESKLRDINESIFSGYTFISIILCVTILICGLIQLIIYRLYIFKKCKI